uniref:RING-type E3 ubiquitin transferase n=2 Tax=Strigidae TaxID=30459 RepID=A0A8C0FV62_BUBBB
MLRRPPSIFSVVTLLDTVSAGELLNPCRCDGSVRYTHQLCLLKWISERGSWTCELCCYRYHVIAIKMKRPCQVICLFVFRNMSFQSFLKTK